MPHAALHRDPLDHGEPLQLHLQPLGRPGTSSWTHRAVCSSLCVLCPLRLPDLGSRRFLCACPSPACPPRLRLPFLGKFRGADPLSGAVVTACLSPPCYLDREFRKD